MSITLSEWRAGDLCNLLEVKVVLGRHYCHLYLQKSVLVIAE